VLGGKNWNFSDNVKQPVIVWQVITQRNTVLNCCFPCPQSSAKPCLITGGDGTDVLSLPKQQARAIPPLLELCAPRHGNNDLVTSRASPICHLNDTMVISAVLYRRKLQKLKIGIFQLYEPVRMKTSQVKIVDSLFQHTKS
jgi:hypothetical protein